MVYESRSIKKIKMFRSTGKQTRRQASKQIKRKEKAAQELRYRRSKLQRSKGGRTLELPIYAYSVGGDMPTYIHERP